MLGKIRFLSGCAVLSCIVFACIAVSPAYSAEKTPVTQYWMSVSTEKGGFPGMPAGPGGGLPSIGSIFGMGRGGSDSGKKLHLEVNAVKGLPADPTWSG